MRLFVWLFVLGKIVLASQSYALIVTVGKYAHIQGLSKMEQEQRYYREVARKWGATKIDILHNESATKEAVLQKLSHIATHIKKGDRFFFFFSGHGSSLYDPLYSARFQEAGLTEWMRDSGALLPYDFSPADISKSVIIGKRDLRPLLERIDAKVTEGVVVFDACFAETTVRGAEGKELLTPFLLTESKGYPYRHLIYIASSITEAQSGIFAPVLAVCSTKQLDIASLQICLNRRMAKRAQIPAVIVPKEAQ